MQVFCFHLMPWAYLPEDFSQTHDSAWVTCPNSLYDPELGHPLYNRYLDELELADQLGFDGVCVNEHHQTAYGGMPSPNIMAACLARRTKQAKLVILGNVLPLYDHPQRVAEEIAAREEIDGRLRTDRAGRLRRHAGPEGGKTQIKIGVRARFLSRAGEGAKMPHRFRVRGSKGARHTLCACFPRRQLARRYHRLARAAGDQRGNQARVIRPHFGPLGRYRGAPGFAQRDLLG